MERRELARRTDEELLDMHNRDRDLATREELVNRFMPFARQLALRYIHNSEPLDDVIQVACVGLLNSIERFDPAHGKQFTTFAAPTILGEIKRYFRDRGWTIHVPRDLQERALAVSRHAERLSVELGRSPTVVELADALSCTVEQAVEAIDAGENYHLTSLDAPVAQDDEDRCALADTLGREDDGYELAEARHALVESWATLSDVERQVLGMRLVHGLTHREISLRIAGSQMHVSRLLRRAMLSLNADEVPRQDQDKARVPSGTQARRHERAPVATDQATNWRHGCPGVRAAAGKAEPISLDPAGTDDVALVPILSGAVAGRVTNRPGRRPTKQHQPTSERKPQHEQSV